MRGRSLLVALIAVIGPALGLAIAGVPTTAKDRPLSERALSITETTTTTAPAPTTVVPTTASTAPSTTLPRGRPAAEVRVRAANATSVNLAATHMTTRLRELGYQTLGPVDAQRTDLATTEVVFSAGFEAEARVLAQALGASRVVPDNPTLTCVNQCTGDIIVYIGRDLAA